MHILSYNHHGVSFKCGLSTMAAQVLVKRRNLGLLQAQAPGVSLSVMKKKHSVEGAGPSTERYL